MITFRNVFPFETFAQFLSIVSSVQSEKGNEKESIVKLKR